MYAKRLDLEDNTEVGKGIHVRNNDCHGAIPARMQLSVERWIFPAQGRLSHMAL